MSLTREDIKNDPKFSALYERIMNVRNHLKISFPSTWKSIFEFLAHPANAVGNVSPRNKYLPVCHPLDSKRYNAPVKGVTRVTYEADEHFKTAKNFVAEACPHPEVFGEQVEKIKVSDIEGIRILLEFSDLDTPSKKTRWYEEDDQIIN